MTADRSLEPDKGWLDYLSEAERAEGFVPFLLQYCGYYYDLIQWMRRQVPAGARILEVGAGSGIMSIILASLGHRVTALDIDREILRRSRDKARLLGVTVDFVQGDMFTLGRLFPRERFDLAFSSGVIEHYDYGVAARALAEQAAVSVKVLAIVPSSLMKDNLRGDERPYTLSTLTRVVKRAGLRATGDFPFGLTDAGQRWRAMLPYAVWYHLVRPRLSASLAVIGASPGRS